jgi:hypothetical protein
MIGANFVMLSGFFLELLRTLIDRLGLKDTLAEVSMELYVTDYGNPEKGPPRRKPGKAKGKGSASSDDAKQKLAADRQGLLETLVRAVLIRCDLKAGGQGAGMKLPRFEQSGMKLGEIPPELLAGATGEADERILGLAGSVIEEEMAKLRTEYRLPHL